MKPSIQSSTVDPSAEAPDFGTRTSSQLVGKGPERALAAVSVGLLLVASLRVLAHDELLVLVWLNSFTLYLYLPAYLALVVALARRRWVLAGIALVGAIAHLIWVVPDFFGPASAESAVPKAGQVTQSHETLRIVSANLFRGNDSLDAALREIFEAEPDVLLLQEYTAGVQERLRGVGIHSQFPYSVEHPQEDPFGAAFFSRKPVEDLKLTWVEDIAFSEALVPLGARMVRVINVHTLPPLSSSYMAIWQRQGTYLLSRAEQSGQPLVLMGDFNATQHSQFYAQLLSRGMNDAHRMLGRGFATTFPNGRMGAPPIRLDHLFLSVALVPLDLREGRGEGSDHRPLIATIALRGK